jgi:(1->4)-alpha-D-glucan 1-alpha-D-glucosylmutase
MENPATFEATHERVLELIADGRVHGLRIDHPDGLFDPAHYFRRLQQRTAGLLYPQRTPLESDRPLYLAAEKILVGDEPLREDWPVHGTTGYDFATLSDALFVDREGEAALDRCYRDFTAADPAAGGRYQDEVYAAKRLVMKTMLSSELHVLASEAARIAEMDPHTRDYTLDALRTALMEVVACFPVYRTYISAQGVSTTDRNQVLKAVAEARRRSRMPDRSVFAFVRDLLLTEIAAGKPTPYQARVLRLAMKFQQYTSPVMAKGVEDTAFYRWHRLSSLNEVGGNPERFGISVEQFHRANQRRQAQWPHAMLAGSTHDAKRSEDVRARLHVLAELPQAWREHVERWARLNRRFRHGGERDEAGSPAGDTAERWPDANTEYLFYQTLLGVWPLQLPDDDEWQGLKARIQGAMNKAVKEAKVHTAWTNADADYEAALAAFIDAVLERERNSAFFDDFLPFQQRVARLGLLNSLSQTLLRLTAPGLPDLYQGCELWDFSLVDPDNRRPVDFDHRHELLQALVADGPDALQADSLEESPLRRLAERLGDGRAKLHLIQRALQLRHQLPALFAQGEYTPLAVEGRHAERLCAFSRSLQGQTVVVVVPRLLAGLSELAVPAAAASTASKDAKGPAEHALAQPSESAAAAARQGGFDPLQDPGWDETWIALPAARFNDVLSSGGDGADRPIEPERRNGHGMLRASTILRHFPVGLLRTSAL